MLIVIVDMDTEKRRRPVVLTENDDIMQFEAVDEIRKVYEGHILELFLWWVFDMDTGAAELLTKWMEIR